MEGRDWDGGHGVRGRLMQVVPPVSGRVSGLVGC